MEAGLSEIARFLALRPPFDALAPEELGEVVAETELEFYSGGERDPQSRTAARSRSCA